MSDGHAHQDLLACPRCGFAPLSSAKGADRELACDECDALYPILDGVPVLVADPGAYLTQHRDAVLAALVEFGDPETLGADAATVARYGEGAARQQVPFDEDWTGPEAHGNADEALDQMTALAKGGGQTAALGAFLAAAAEVRGPAEALVSLGGGDLGVTAEVGCGAGTHSGALAASTETLVLVDASFRAVMLARAACPAAALGVVMDAENLALADGAFDCVAALNLVDVLTEPAAFLEGAHRALTHRGQLLLTTPDPALGLRGGPPTVLTELAENLGFAASGRDDLLPWLRVHGPREAQVYLVQALCLTRVPDA